MNTAIVIFTLFSYFVSALFLLGSATLGFVSTKKNKALVVALLLFVLPPLALVWAKVVIPILVATTIGYGIVILGVLLRKQLFVWKDQLLEEIKKNLSDEGVDEEEK